VALACATVAGVDPDAVVAILPTDHVIPDREAFTRSVRVAAAAADDGALVCLGIKPDRPATGFGYLKCDGRPSIGATVPVDRFVEKPDLATARRYLRSGKYLWNAGMFIWRVDRFAEELRRTAPGIGSAIEGHLAGKKTAWNRATRLSIDYAVMEKARGVRVGLLDAGWNDVGSWDAAAALAGSAGVVSKDHILVDSPGSVVFGDERTVAVVDVPDVVVVDTKDALLVVSRDGSERVREVVDELKRKGRKDLL
jgi:mannose-1-phosphate guanylyltransferase